MSKICNGEELNKNTIEKLVGFIKSWHVGSTLPPEQTYKTDYTNDKGENIYLFADPNGAAPERFVIVNDLLQYLSFDKVKDEDLYELPGMAIPTDLTDKTKTDNYTICVTKENAKKIVKNAQKFKEQLGITFPQELFQIAKENIIPGLTYSAPEPKKVSETQEEYEARMESHYKGNGVEKEPLEKYRQPYPHEKTDYTKEPPIMTAQGRASYQEQLQAKALAPDVAKKGGKGMPEGKQKRVVDTDPTLGQKIYNTYNKGKAILKSKTLRIGLLTAGGIALSGVLIPSSTVAIGIVMAATPVAAALGIHHLYKKYGKPKIKQIKEKIKDWFKGKKIEEEPTTEVVTEPKKGKDNNPTTEPEKGKGSNPTTEPEKGKGGPQGGGAGGNNGGSNGGNNGGSGDVTPPDRPVTVPSNQVEVPEDLPEVLREIEPENEMLKQIQTRAEFARKNIAALKGKLANPTLTEDDKKEIERQLEAENEKLTTLIEQEKRILSNVYDMIQQFVYGKNKENGGPTL